MKHTKHENRKSFAKWGMTAQLTMTRDAERLLERRQVALLNDKPITNIGKNNGPLKNSHHAQIASQRLPAFLKRVPGHNRMLPRNVGRSRGGVRVGSKARVIPSEHYAAYLNGSWKP